MIYRFMLQSFFITRIQNRTPPQWWRIFLRASAQAAYYSSDANFRDTSVADSSDAEQAPLMFRPP